MKKKLLFVIIAILSIIGFTGFFSGANAQPAAPVVVNAPEVSAAFAPDVLSRITGVIWEGKWYYRNDTRDRDDAYTEMELKADGTYIYNHVRNKKPWKSRYIVERENTFSVTSASGKKLIFDVLIKPDGDDTLFGYAEANPNLKIIMKKKK